MDAISKKKCSHHKTNTSKTCFSKNSLLKIAKAFNQHNPNDQIKTSASKIELWNNLRIALSKNCLDDEKCWTEQNFMKNAKNDEINHFTFKPKYPSSWDINKHTWLNSLDIYYLMKQFERKYKDFVFFGPVPSDCPTSFQCELSSMNPLDLQKKQNINKIGIIYNLDKHDQEGSHWTAVFIDTPNKEINYYDSYGEKPPNIIFKFMKTMFQQFNNNEQDVSLIFNNKRHQYGGSECGIYSIFFILQRLEGATMYDIYNKNIQDRDMNDLRFLLYRN